MKTKAIEFSGACTIGWCGSHNDTPNRGGVQILLDDDIDEEGWGGESVCCDCAMRLARLLKKRVKQVSEKQAQGLKYRAGADGCTMRWRKKKTPAAA